MHVLCEIEASTEAVFHLTQQFTRNFTELLHLLTQIDDKYRMKDKRLLKAMHYIRTNYQNNIVQSALARHVGLAPSTLAQKFMELTHRTFKQILNEVRVAKAVTMIWETNESLENIAFDCGFGTGRTFTREFRQNTGFTPSDFRDICNRSLQIETDSKTFSLRYDEMSGYTKAGDEINHYRTVVAAY